ncbi:MAG: cation diffusion facilitator family transporter [Bacteroidales bacterium]
MDKELVIVRASWVGIVGNALLSILKIVIGIISGSMAVVGDGIDSATDIITSLITLFTAKMMRKKPNIRYAYGYYKADTVASKALAFVIFFAGFQLALTTCQRLINNEVSQIPSFIAIVVTLISIVGKFFLARFQMFSGRKVKSAMLIANGKNMQNDILISSGVLLGLIFTYWLKMPILDFITALAISIYIMYSAITIFLEVNRDLMDGIDDTSLYYEVVKSSVEVKGVYNPHRIRIRRLGDKILIALDIEVKGSISVKESHEIAHRVEKNIKNKIEDVYDIIIHIEPYGLHHEKEVFGVAPCHLNVSQKD